MNRSEFKLLTGMLITPMIAMGVVVIFLIGMLLYNLNALDRRIDTSLETDKILQDVPEVSTAFQNLRGELWHYTADPTVEQLSVVDNRRSNFDKKYKLLRSAIEDNETSICKDGSKYLNDIYGSIVGVSTYWDKVMKLGDSYQNSSGQSAASLAQIRSEMVDNMMAGDHRIADSGLNEKYVTFLQLQQSYAGDLGSDLDDSGVGLQRLALGLTLAYAVMLFIFCACLGYIIKATVRFAGNNEKHSRRESK